MNRRALVLVTLLFATLPALFACADGVEVDDPNESEPEATPVAEPEDAPGDDLAGWTEATHSNDVPPDLDRVFVDHDVQRIDIVMPSAEWNVMLTDMTSTYGAIGASSDGPGGGGPGGGGPGGGGPGGGGLLTSDEDPVFVPANIIYDDILWENVGVRFKGNSSLQSAWGAGILKLSLKLDFDEFEDEFPEIDNQRFFGIKKLSLKNNYDDPALMREKVMADAFADAGLVVSRTAFFDVYLDHGDGPEYFGLYTLVEEVDDSVIKTRYDNNDGNLYKPDGAGASFAAGTFDEDHFVKKTNEGDEDWSDIEELFAVLHSDERLSDPAAWRASLDTIFDTDVFLHYLALNTLAQNWDTYGRMTHNYFLYASPNTGKLTWIPWDNNEALQTGKMGGALALDFSNLDSAQWPLIGYLYADDEYRARYDAFLANLIGGPLSASVMQARYAAYEDLLRPHAEQERDGYTFIDAAGFTAGVSVLKSHATSREAAAEAYLQTP